MRHIPSPRQRFFVCLERALALVPSLLKPVEWHKRYLRERLLRRQGTWQDRITLHFWVQPPLPRGTSKPGADGYIANYQQTSCSPSPGPVRTQEHRRESRPLYPTQEAMHCEGSTARLGAQAPCTCADRSLVRTQCRA